MKSKFMLSVATVFCAASGPCVGHSTVTGITIEAQEKLDSFGQRLKSVNLTQYQKATERSDEVILTGFFDRVKNQVATEDQPATKNPLVEPVASAVVVGICVIKRNEI